MAPLDTKPSGAPKGVWKSGKGRGRHTPKGRQFTDEAQAEITRLLGDHPRRRDLLIEFLHLIQDEHGHISADHIADLWRAAPEPGQAAGSQGGAGEGGEGAFFRL